MQTAPQIPAHSAPRGQRPVAVMASVQSSPAASAPIPAVPPPTSPALTSSSARSYLTSRPSSSPRTAAIDLILGRHPLNHVLSQLTCCVSPAGYRESIPPANPVKTSHRPGTMTPRGGARKPANRAATIHERGGLSWFRGRRAGGSWGRAGWLGRRPGAP